MPYISDGELLHPAVAEKARRKALLYTWLLAVAFLVGAPGAYFVTNILEVSYTAEGSLWIEAATREGSNGSAAMQAGIQPESNGWIELLRSRTVLDPVVVGQQLYLRAPEVHAQAFVSFTVTEDFGTGPYELRVGDGGEHFILIHRHGSVVQRGTLGSPIGHSMGFSWTPSRASFAPGATVEFTLLSLRDAARNLSGRLRTASDVRGGLLQVGLSGSDPTEVVDVLNAVMERHVDLAYELKNAKIEELQAILERQLKTVELDLERAGRDFEEFKIGKSRASSDPSLPLAERIIEEKRLNREVQLSEDLYSELRTRVEAARIAAASSAPDIRILDRASVTDRPDKGIRFLIALAIFFGCVAVALGGALVLNRISALNAPDS